MAQSQSLAVFENYYLASTGVTHIICSNLPDSKYTDFRSVSKKQQYQPVRTKQQVVVIYGVLKDL